MAENKKDDDGIKDDEEQRLEAEIDDALEQSFPASDPPPWTLGTDHHVEPKVDTSNDEEG